MKRWVLARLLRRPRKPLEPLEPPRKGFRWLEIVRRAAPAWLRLGPRV